MVIPLVPARLQVLPARRSYVPPVDVVEVVDATPVDEVAEDALAAVPIVAPVLEEVAATPLQLFLKSLGMAADFMQLN